MKQQREEEVGWPKFWINTKRLECKCVVIRASDPGSVGGDGRAGSRGEKKDPGVPGHNPKDAVPAPHPGPLISGLASTSSCHPSVMSGVLLAPYFLQSIVQHFLVLLMTSSDESLRFLSFRLDFTEHYRCAFQNTLQTKPRVSCLSLAKNTVMFPGSNPCLCSAKLWPEI